MSSILIFVIPSIYPNENNLQSGIFIHEQCKALLSEGHKVVVLDASSYGVKHWLNNNCFFSKHCLLDNVDILSLHHFGLMSSSLPIVNTKLYMNKLKRLYRIATKLYGRPDVFYAHFTFQSGFCTYLLSKKTNIPFMVMEHHSLFLQSMLNKHIRKMIIQTVENSNCFICVSETLKNAIIKWTGTDKKIIVIPNLIDERFCYHTPSNDLTFTFFSAGNLVPSKKFDLLIEAFCKAFANDEKVCLKIAGAGVEYEKLNRLIKDKKRENQIILLGRLNRDEMLKQYIGCKCFVLPSQYETFGIVYREAMAVGRPIISTKNGGIQDGWEDKFGKLIDIGNEVSLINAMQMIYLSIDDYDTKYISNACLNRFSARKIAGKISDMLKAIVTQRP